MIPLNQPQKTGLSGLEPVTLIVASSSIPWPHSYQKKSLWWPMWGQSARYSMGLRLIVEPSGLVAWKERAVGILYLIIAQCCS